MGCEPVRVVYDGSAGAIKKPMLSPTHEADTFPVSFARCAYRAVVSISRWPSSRPNMARLSPNASALLAQRLRGS